MRARLDGEVYDEVFRFVLGIVESKGLLRGKVAGVDSTYLRADASMKSIVRKETGDDYTTYLKKLCEAQGIENPTVEDARRMDRACKGKKVSNEDWASPTDADARIVRLKDGSNMTALQRS
jgi:transposase